MSGRAVEASGDVDVILLDKTGTITYGNRLAASITAAPGRRRGRGRSTAALVASLRDETPEGRSIVELARKRLGRARTRRRAPATRPASRRSTRTIAEEHPVPRRDPHERRRACATARLVLKGAVDAIAREARRGAARRASAPRPTAIAGRRRDAAGDPRRDGRDPRPDRAQGHGQGRARRALRRVPQDGHPDGDDHRRQPADRGDDRPGGRRRRLHRPGQARGQDRLHPRASRPTATSSR